MLRMLVIAIIIALMVPAFSMEQHDHNSLGLAGDFYAGWKRPTQEGPRVSSCCNQKDCHQALVRGSVGHWEYMSHITGRWTTLPEGILEHNQEDPRESPDGLPHVCEQFPSGKVLCAVLGGGI